MDRKPVKKKRSPPKGENPGTAYYEAVGRTLMGCGGASLLLLLFVNQLPQNYEAYNIPLVNGLWAMASLLLLLSGLALLLLCRRSAPFRQWAERELLCFSERQLRKELQREKKKQEQ